MTKCHLHIEYIHSKLGKDWQQHRKRTKRKKKVSRYKEGTHSWQRYLTRQGADRPEDTNQPGEPRRHYDEIRTSCQVWIRNTQTKSIVWKEAGNEQLFFRWNRQFLDSDCTPGIAFSKNENWLSLNFKRPLPRLGWIDQSKKLHVGISTTRWRN